MHDIQNITSSYKSWLYQDMLIKPEEMVLHRPHNQGGLGLHSVKYKAMAGFITSFLQTAANPEYRPSLLHSLLFRKHVLRDEDVPGVPTQPPPYFSQEMLLGLLFCSILLFWCVILYNICYLGLTSCLFLIQVQTN